MKQSLPQELCFCHLPKQHDASQLAANLHVKKALMLPLSAWTYRSKSFHASIRAHDGKQFGTCRTNPTRHFKDRGQPAFTSSKRPSTRAVWRCASARVSVNKSQRRFCFIQALCHCVPH